MSEFKGTPGQWRWVGFFDGSYYELKSDDNSRCGCVIDDGSAGGVYLPSIDVNGADARLIAAAPDLLAALQEFVSLFPDIIEGDAVIPTIEMAEAAIERALHGDDADA